MKKFSGTGLGLRRSFIKDLARTQAKEINFLEIAPENWLGAGGQRAQDLQAFSERYPIICHGLSLSIGGPAPLDIEFVKNVKAFLDHYNVPCYSEHLSYCGDEGHLYDLLPIPFTDEAVHYVAERVNQVQDILERPLVLENVSYYCAPGKEISEIDFINQVMAETNCHMLLDVNNVYVNSVNHGYDPIEYFKQLKPNKVSYIHMAGHFQQQQDLIIDTHGEDIIDPVWALLAEAYKIFGVVPTLLERDFNIPPLNELLLELKHIRTIQQQYNNESTP